MHHGRSRTLIKHSSRLCYLQPMHSQCFSDPDRYQPAVPLDTIEYIGFRSLLAYVDHASVVAILRDIAREEFISANDSNQRQRSATTVGIVSSSIGIDWGRRWWVGGGGRRRDSWCWCWCWCCYWPGRSSGYRS